MEHKNKSDVSNNMFDWNHLRIIHKIPESHTERTQNRGTTEKSHTGHCTPTADSTAVKVQYTFGVRNSITCAMNCNHRIAATLYATETRLVCGI